MRGLLMFVVGVFILIGYADAAVNLYEFFKIVITGEVPNDLKFSFSNLFLTPIILYVIVLSKRLWSLLPLLNLSIFTYWITEFTLLITKFGFNEGSTLIQQSIFLVLGLVFLIGMRWLLSSIYYTKYEVNKNTLG